MTLQELLPPLRLPAIVTIDHEVRESGWQFFVTHRGIAKKRHVSNEKWDEQVFRAGERLFP
jgi:hypothetical protein